MATGFFSAGAAASRAVRLQPATAAVPAARVRNCRRFIGSLRGGQSLAIGISRREATLLRSATMVHVLLAACLLGPADASKPDVLIVMTADQGLGDFSFMGNPVLKTPRLDAFAKEAVRLTDFHVCPMSSPTRGQLMTGVAALRNGATSVTAGRTFLRPGLPTMPEVFARAGYKTGIFGKWHLEIGR